MDIYVVNLQHKEDSNKTIVGVEINNDLIIGIYHGRVAIKTPKLIKNILDISSCPVLMGKDYVEESFNILQRYKLTKTSYCYKILIVYNLLKEIIKK